MKLAITTTAPEPTRDEVRAMFDDHAALVRLARRFEVRGDGRRWVGEGWAGFQCEQREAWVTARLGVVRRAQDAANHSRR